MPLQVVEEHGVRVLEGEPGASLMKRPQDAALVIEACLSARIIRVLLHPEHVTPRFFDLSSSEAGEVLDKLRSFGIRLALVCPPGEVRFSSRFQAILSNDLGIFETRHDALAWLSGGPTE
jgi:hypothetical protein